MEAQAGTELGQMVTGLGPDREYNIYAVAVDKVIDMDKTADDKNPVYTGNVSDVAELAAFFKTKKVLPVITRIPSLSGTYGQRVKDMELSGGVAQGMESAALEGEWTVDEANNEIPSVGITAKVKVTFTPKDSFYDTVTVEIIPAVSARSLEAEGVTISEVKGTYVYTGSEIRPSVQPVQDGGASTGQNTGIRISDDEAVLTQDDFEVSYSSNTDAGTAKVMITGKGNYTGQVMRAFTIEKVPGKEISVLTGSETNDGKTYTYTISYIDGAVYRMDGGEWSSPGQADGNVFANIKPGITAVFYAKIPGDKNHEDGKAAKKEVAFLKLTPAAPVLSYTRTTDEQTGEITLSITPVEGAQYSFDGGQTWESGENANVKAGFDKSQTGKVILAIRLAATDTHNESKIQKVEVDLSLEEQPAPPAFALGYEANGETDYIVTIPSTEGCEYSFDGVTWFDNNVKSGVKAGEIVTGYKRYKAKDGFNAGSAASTTEILPRFTVKTPVISPAGGNFSGTVSGTISVEISCESEGAEIYYTTDGSGSTPNRSSARYTAAFTVTVPATVKAVAIKEGLTDSAVATAVYTKTESGSTGGNGSGGGSGSGFGGNSGSSDGGGTFGGNDGSGDLSGNDGDLENSSGSSFAEDNNGDSSSQNTGGSGVSGLAAQGADISSSVLGITAASDTQAGIRSGRSLVAVRTAEVVNKLQKDREPFIKNIDGKSSTTNKYGWNVIRAEEEKAEDGNTINVDMNGATVVPGDIFDRIGGRDITITFDMGNGILWSVDGKSIMQEGTVSDVDFTVNKGVDFIPLDVINRAFGENYNIQISLAYEGEFGFTAVLFINLGKENAGHTASLYYYNESSGELEFICADEIAGDGTAEFAFNHASEYVIVVEGRLDGINEDKEAVQKESGNSTEDLEGADDNGEGIDLEEEIETSQGKKILWPFAAGIIVLAGVCIIGAVSAGRKKKKSEKE